ncbi:50S ribosomal protein L11 methyltransferase [Sphingomonas donggukensis]|uniref:50S ribosomal protein L11 methyltransferase n=1 Tax=Sphingomonas donggukensis TaxID=2949093 RepID=A0ABY4TUS5_9SPHN|nr:50S ribosomal protein L11 methyltransferase [Sphingomonas donggukensis]URW76155.1 50S ribosomal protein L11 methyltransferase [Sphingomonas donggukensis]
MGDDGAAVRGLVSAGFEGLVRAAAGDARKLAGLARTAKSAGHRDRAYPLARAARALAPGDVEIAALTQRPLAGAVPKFHLPMLRDAPRNRMYADAIARVVRPGDRVLDIGSGSGLLAMIAARAGAGHVYSCEMNPAVADVAATIVAANGLTDRVTVLPVNSAALDADRDLGGRVDVIISEIFSDDVIGEGVLPATEDAVARLLRPGGRVLPCGAQIVAALASNARADTGWMTAIEGFDLSAFAALAPVPQRYHADGPHLTLRSPPRDLFSFDLSSGGPWRAAQASVDFVADGEPVDGVALWLRFQLDDAATYENRPGAGSESHWMVCFHRFLAPLHPAASAIVRVRAAHDLSHIHLWPAVA